MADIKQLERALINADAAGDADAARALAGEIRKMRSAPKAGPAAAESSLMGDIAQGAGNLVAGAVRGAGSIGATILAPYDMAKDAIAGKGLSLESNRQRRAGIDGGLQLMGAETDSMLYKGGKLAGEIAGTAGVGSALGIGAKAAGAAPSVVNALTTSGFRAGATPGAANMLTRMAGGAATGGAMAGLVNPEDAAMGAAIGGALPPLAKLAGSVGSGIKRGITGAPANPRMLEAARAGAQSGYVVPPADLSPGIGTELLSGLSGKIKTAQVASQRNQDVTNKLAGKALGLADDAPLTVEALGKIREQAGAAYEAVASAGSVSPGASYAAALDDAIKPFVSQAKSFPGRKAPAVVADIQALKTEAFDAGDAIEAIKVLRNDADAAYRSGDKLAGKAYKKAVEALEGAIDEHLVKTGAPQDLLKNYRGARQTIAKSYTVQSALNPETGAVNASKLAGDLLKGKPLSGELRNIGEFSAAFPRATQALKETPKALSPLDYAVTGTASLTTGNVLPLALLGARPVARNMLLSGPMQRAAMQVPGQNRLSSLMQGAVPLAYRTAPLIPGQ
jgi:hypothetical protein